MNKKKSYGGWIKLKIYLLHSTVTSLSYTAKPTGWENDGVLQHVREYRRAFKQPLLSARNMFVSSGKAEFLFEWPYSGNKKRQLTFIHMLY